MNYIHQSGVRVIQAKMARHSLEVRFCGVQPGDTSDIAAQFLARIASRVGTKAVPDQMHIVRIQAIICLHLIRIKDQYANVIFCYNRK